METTFLIISLCLFAVVMFGYFFLKGQLNVLKDKYSTLSQSVDEIIADYSRFRSAHPQILDKDDPDDVIEAFNRTRETVYDWYDQIRAIESKTSAEEPELKTFEVAEP
jgi:hypothetical protein